MPTVDANGIRICYESHGREDLPALLLVRGLGTQLIHWPAELIDALVDGALGVIYGLEVARALAEDDETRQLAVDAISWQDEESRFFGCLGSRSFCGLMTPQMEAGLKDKDGVAFSDALVDGGLRVVCFDNRDTGLSEQFSAAGPVDIPALLARLAAGQPADVPYRLEDMAADIVGLLDALGIARAHVLGISLGGMIVQVLTAGHPGRVVSMTSVMSSSGNPELPQGDPAVMALLLRQPADPQDREAVIAETVSAEQAYGSPGYPIAEPALRAGAAAAYDRCYNPDGVTRQMAAARASGDRRPLLARIATPAYVIHGADDPLAAPQRAGRLARNSSTMAASRGARAGGMLWPMPGITS